MKLGKALALLVSIAGFAVKAGAHSGEQVRHLQTEIEPTESDAEGTLEVGVEVETEGAQLSTGTLMKICDYSVTYVSSQGHCRGLWFTAPTMFCIVGLNVPNEMNEPTQNVQVFVMDSEPPNYPIFASEGSVFHAAGEPADVVIPTEIQVQEGKHVGILGTAGDIPHNSYCLESSYDSSIDGQLVTLKRFFTQSLGVDNNIANGPAESYSTETRNVGRVEMYYTPGVCPVDSDGDGVWDHVDACPDTEEGAVVDDDGCSIAQLCPCEDAQNHGDHVSCVVHVTDDFVKAGLISEEEEAEIQCAAAHSNCGKDRRKNLR